jgi:hypothetical protein
MLAAMLIAMAAAVSVRGAKQVRMKAET